MPDLDGLALLRALVTQQRLALAGGGTGTGHTAVSPAGYLSMTVGTKALAGSRTWRSRVVVHLG